MMDDHETLCRARNGFIDALKELLKPEIMGADDFRNSLHSALEGVLALTKLLCERRLEMSGDQSRYSVGGLEERFVIERTDGKPIPSSRRYSLVLDFSGADPYAIIAAEAYATSVENENPQLAVDIRAAIADPNNAPKQHRY